MKRILCILDSLDAGGAETFLMKLSRSIPGEQYQFDFVVSHGGGVYTQEIINRGGKIFEVSPRKKNLYKALCDIKSIVKTNKYDCVLKLGNTPIMSLDLLAAKLGGAKRLGFRSCNALTGLSVKENVINAIMRPFLNKIANLKLAPSMLAAEFTFGKKAAHYDVHLLHNGVDLEVFHFDTNGRKQIRAEFNLGDNLVIGHVGRFHKQKNHRYLLEVFDAIKRRCPDAKLLLVGCGELENSIRAWIQELGLEDNVILTGTRFDVPQLLSAMDVFIFPSLHEGMPNTVIEAQATGLPCVIADTITKECNITGLVDFLSLSISPENWAEAALSVADLVRKDTSIDFLDNNYDIQSVVEQFVSMFFSNEIG